MADGETTVDSPVEGAIARVRAGDVDAFAEVIRAFQDDVWKIVAFALKDLATTEDLVQQVFVNAFLKLDSYEDGRDFGAWVRTIARNRVRDELRRSLREEKRLTHYQEYLLDRFDDPDRADREEDRLRDALERCKKKLAPAAARAVRMRYDEAMGFDEIARLLDRTVAATRQMLARIRGSLRDCIKERMAQS